MGQYLDYVIATHTTPTNGHYSQPEVAARVIGAASAPISVPGTSASKITMLLLLILIALAVGLALAFLLDYLDDRVHSSEDIKDIFQYPVIGEVPHAPAPERRTHTGQPVTPETRKNQECILWDLLHQNKKLC